jgi:hypothetical protein
MEKNRNKKKHIIPPVSMSSELAGATLRFSFLRWKTVRKEHQYGSNVFKIENYR